MNRRLVTMVALESQFAVNVLDVPAAARGGKDMTRLISATRVEVSPGTPQIETGTYTGDGAVGGQAVAVSFGAPTHLVVMNDAFNGASNMFVKNDRMAGDQAFRVGTGLDDPLITRTGSGFTADGAANTADVTYIWTAFGPGINVGAGLIFTALDVIGNGEHNSSALVGNQVRLDASAPNRIVRIGALTNPNWLYVFVFETDQPLPHAV